MTDTKPIDLGKLQDVVKAAAAMLKARRKAYAIACEAINKAQRRAETLEAMCEADKMVLDRAKKSMIDGARTVANG